ncbi:hypothetical protein INR49_003475, partial [Caranx melampygus]
MSLPPEKASELKQIIHNHLVKMDIHGKIREVLAETVKGDQGPAHRSLSEADFLRALQSRGIVDDVMKDLHFAQEAAAGAETGPHLKPATHFVDKDLIHLKKSNIDPSRRCRTSKCLEVRPSWSTCRSRSLYLGRCARLSRSTCTSATRDFAQSRCPAPVNPAGGGLPLRDPQRWNRYLVSVREGSKMVDATTMLSLCDPVHLVLIKTDTSSETTLVSSYFLDWRTVLSSPSGKTCFAVELMGVETLSSDIISTQCDDVTVCACMQQSLERQRTQRKRGSSWFMPNSGGGNSSRSGHRDQSKMVKIFAQDENGISRPVCSYVRVLRAGRLLESPRQAARFVSLLAHEKARWWEEGEGSRSSGRDGVFLLSGDCGTTPPCCGLLLGFGLDAYVCGAPKHRECPHTWVLTRGTTAAHTFWESVTAQRYDVPSQCKQRSSLLDTCRM